MQTTTDSFGLMTPRLMSTRVAASVVPPAGSVKMPSVAASSSMALRISSSLTIAPLPPVSLTTFTTWNPSAGVPIASD